MLSEKLRVALDNLLPDAGEDEASARKYVAIDKEKVKEGGPKEISAALRQSLAFYALWQLCYLLTYELNC